MLVVVLLSSRLNEGRPSNQPAIHAVMAFTAIHGKALRPMIGALRLVECLEMAAHTFRRQGLPIELPDSSRRVTRIAIHNRMRTDERETILVLVDVVHRHRPAVHVVT